MKLQIDLIPATSFGCNLRGMMKRSKWDIIRHAIYEKQNNCCAICGAVKGFDCERLNAHEVWEYNEDDEIQKLVDIIAVCDNCHNCIHYGRTEKIAFTEWKFWLIDETIKHYMKINNCSEEQFKKDYAKAWDTWLKRSSHNWTLDISHLKEMGFKEIYEIIKKEPIN